MFHFDQKSTTEQPTKPSPLTYALPSCQGDGELATHVWLTDGGEPQEGKPCQCGKVTYRREGR